MLPTFVNDHRAKELIVHLLRLGWNLLWPGDLLSLDDGAALVQLLQFLV